jgi:hypothetical protein
MVPEIPGTPEQSPPLQPIQIGQETIGMYHTTEPNLVPAVLVAVAVSVEVVDKLVVG